MAYQRLPEYQINFPLFKVSEPWKFQMSSFCVSTDETHIVQNRPFFLIPNRMTKWVIWHNGIPKASKIYILLSSVTTYFIGCVRRPLSDVEEGRSVSLQSQQVGICVDIRKNSSVKGRRTKLWNKVWTEFSITLPSERQPRFGEARGIVDQHYLPQDPRSSDLH